MTIKEVVAANLHSGMTVRTIAEKYSIKWQTVTYYMNKMGIKLEGSGGKNKIINHNPFLENSDSSDYWLGYITADGCVNSKTNAIQLISKDQEHLDKYNHWLGGILHRHGPRKNGIIGYNFSNKTTKDFLISIGITPRKSLTLELKRPITWAFLRGVFDGDGSVRIGIHRSEIKITSGSTKFLYQIQAFLEEQGVKSFVRIQQKIPTGNDCYMIGISMHNATLFFDKLYKNAEVLLERKYDIMQRIAEKRRVKSGELLGGPATDNQQPSSANDIKVAEKVQRIGIEESTNNIPTSARHPE